MTGHDDRLRDESGFTIIELVVALTILGIVSAALVLSTFSVLKFSKESQDTARGSYDRDLSAAVFANDVFGVSSTSVSLNVAATCVAATTSVVQTRGTSFDDSGTAPADVTTVADYYVKSGELRRTTCTLPGAGATSGTPVAGITTVVAHNVTGAAAAWVSGSSNKQVSLTVTSSVDGTTWSLLGTRRTT